LTAPAQAFVYCRLDYFDALLAKTANILQIKRL